MPMIDPRPFLLLLCVQGLACVESEAPGAGAAGTTGTSSTPDTSITANDPPTTTTLDAPTTLDDPEPTTAGSTGDHTDATSSGSGDPPIDVPVCGDGIVNGDEECDEGSGVNDDNLFCKENCALNVCGDGKLFVGWELCDEGAANSDQYGSVCGGNCKPAARCGDSMLQPEFETCDLGINNESEIGDAQGILCSSSCRALQLRGFITADAFSGDLTGPSGADLKCRAAATWAGLAEPERFSAYLSTGNIHAKERFEKVAASLPYVLVTGKKIADNFAALIEAGPLGQGISVTEHGVTLEEAYVATNTDPGGLSHGPDHCQSWTSADAAYNARAGFNALPVGSPDAATWKDEQWWTGVEERPCHKILFHLYCLEI